MQDVDAPPMKEPLVKPLAILLLLGLTAPSALTAADRPNVVWLVSEDNSVHYARLYGHELGAMPHIEAMAKQGVVFDHAFSNAPVCSVARTTLQTGMYGPRIGAHYHRKLQPVALPDGAKLLPAYLRAAGYYATNNSKTDFNVIAKDVWDESSKKATWRNRPEKSQPFFHMQSFGVSHESSLHFNRQTMENTRTATDPAAVEIAPYHPDTPTFRYTYARYFDRMAAVDAQIGAVVKQLEEDGLLEETIVFYFGDHGGVLPGSKGYTREAGLHVPLVVRIPEKWRKLIPYERGTRAEGVVSFVDFAPTVLHLAGVEVPRSMDGRAFLGEGITREDVESRDETYGHADRFDEKSDFVRTLRKGRYKYVRNFEPFYPEGLQNNYRYKMLAYEEWRALDRAGKLNETQRAFFAPKPAEALYDVEVDPHETRNLAADPEHTATLHRLRSRLGAIERALPDLSFYPESVIVDEAIPNVAGFGREHAEEIDRLADVADLALLDFDDARPGIDTALQSESPWARYWGLTVCASFGDEANGFTTRAKVLLDDEEPLVRVRAAEFLALIDAADPRPTIRDVLATTKSSTVAGLTLNAVVFLQDGPPGIEFEPDDLKPMARNDVVNRRFEYLVGKPNAKKQRRGK